MNQNQLDLLYKDIENNFGKIDFIINNAGYNKTDSIQDLAVEEYSKIMDSNLNSKYLVIKKFLALIKNSEHGRIINMSSRYSYKRDPNRFAYCISQSALITLTEIMALECAKYGITINSISPSLFKSETRANMYAPDFFEKETHSNPLKKICSYNDIWNIIEFLCKEESSFISGANIHVSGADFINRGINYLNLVHEKAS